MGADPSGAAITARLPLLRLRAVEAVGRPAWRLPRLPQPSKRIVIGFAALIVVGIASIAAINLYIVYSQKGKATSVIADVPHAQVAIVPGAQVRPTAR